MCRLYSDEGYLVTAARRFGLEAGQGGGIAPYWAQVATIRRLRPSHYPTLIVPSHLNQVQTSTPFYFKFTIEKLKFLVFKV